MTTGEKNFIDSKDNIYYNFPTNCLLQVTLFDFIIADILLCLFDFEYKFICSSLFGFIFAIVIAVTDILNICLRIFLRKKYQLTFYGVCTVLISLYLSYIVIKVALYPFNQLFGLLSIGIWVVTSLLFIYAIIDNIKKDRYNDNSEYIYFFRDKKNEDCGKKYGIVITKYTKLIGLIYILIAVSLIVVYFTNKEQFKESGKLLMDYGQCILIIALNILCYFFNLGWKLIIKQIYVNKYIKE